MALDPIVSAIVEARVSLLFKQAFFGNLVTRLELVDATKWCPTAATDGRKLYYNREFIKKLTKEEIMFLTSHEILHAVYDHIGRRGNRNPQIYNMATDYIVNYTLVSNRIGVMPKNGLYNEKYTDELSSEEVYNLLVKDKVKIEMPLDMHLTESEKKAHDKSCKSCGGTGQKSEEQKKKDQAKKDQDKKNKADKGKGDPGKGDPGEGDPDENGADGQDGEGQGEGQDGQDGQNGQSQGKGKGQGNQPGGQGGSSGSGQGGHDHEHGDGEGHDHGEDGDECPDCNGTGQGQDEDGNGGNDDTRNVSVSVGGDENGPPVLTDEDLEQIKQELRSALVSASQAAGAGNVPKGLARLIDSLSDPKMDWRELLATHFKSAIKDDYSWNRPSRRSWSTGCCMPGQKNQDTIDIVISIDTSGSMTEEMLRDFLSEVKGIMQIFQDFKISLFTFDTKVYGYKEFTQENIDEIGEYPMLGGGGTMFECTYEFMKAMEIEPERYVMFTDGWPNATWGDPDYCDTLFVIYGDNRIEAPYGLTAYYDDSKPGKKKR